VDDQPTRAETESLQTGEFDFDLLPSLIGYHLRRAQISVFNDFVRTMAEQKVTPGQFGVLDLISANPGLTQSALARAVGIERSTMVAVIDALEARKLVERRRAPTDRRSYALVLTTEGIALLDRLKPMVLDHEKRIAADLSARERDALISLLKRIGG
jgi:DNA-binding MarR family transcriptional regulator